MTETEYFIIKYYKYFFFQYISTAGEAEQRCLAEQIPVFAATRVSRCTFAFQLIKAVFTGRRVVAVTWW